MPSEKVLNAKKAKVEELSNILKEATAGVLVDYTGISVEDDTKLRRALREADVKYTVEKNSVLRFAFKNAQLDGLSENLAGATALAVSVGGDQTAAARILGEYAKKSNGKFTLKSGFIDSDIYDAQGVVALSKIPSKEILLSQLVGSLQGPMQQLAAIIKAVADSKENEAA